MTSDLREAVAMRRGLGPMADALRQRACRIAYAGNSITAQRDGYAPRFHDLVRASTGQPHIAIQAGLSAMGSMGCLFTLDPFVLSRKPDLCFIECTVGDSSSKQPIETIGPAVEGLLRKLKASGCTACILHAARNDGGARDLRPIIDCYERVAEHYGIPSIHVGRTIGQGIAAGRWTMDQLFLDGTHTTRDGADVMAGLIAEAVIAMTAIEPDTLASQQRPLHADHLESARLLLPARNMVRDPLGCHAARFRLVLDYLEIDAGNTLTIDHVPGNLAGLLLVAGPHSGDVAIDTTEDQAIYRTWDRYCDRDVLRTLVFPKPIQPRSKLSLTVLNKGGAADATAASRKLMKLVGFMLYDEH